MDKIFGRAEDKYVKGTYVYVSEGEAFADKACTVQLTAVELENLFLKGAVIVDEEVYYKPVSFSVDTITYVKANTTTPTTAVLATAVAA